MSKFYSLQVHKFLKFTTEGKKEKENKEKRSLSTYTFLLEVTICLAHNRNSVVVFE